jgi:hypothetical protein
VKILPAVLFGVGYPACVAVLSRFTAVVREQRWRWLAVHHLGVVAIIAGWVLRRRGVGVALNGSWLVASSLWYAVGGRRRR